MLSLFFGIFLGASGLLVYENKRAIKSTLQQILDLKMSFSASSFIGLGLIYQILSSSLKEKTAVRIEPTEYLYAEVSDEKGNNYGIVIPPEVNSETYIRVNETSNLFGFNKGLIRVIIPGEYLNDLKEKMRGFEEFEIRGGSCISYNQRWKKELYDLIDSGENPVE